MLTYSKKPVACFSVAFIYAALSVNWLWTLFNFIELVCVLRWALRLSSSSERKFFVCMALHFRDKWCAVCHTECYCSNCSCHDQLSRSSEIGRWNCCYQKEKSPKIFSVYWKITSRIVMCARKLREVFFFFCLLLVRYHELCLHDHFLTCASLQCSNWEEGLKGWQAAA